MVKAIFNPIYSHSLSTNNFYNVIGHRFELDYPEYLLIPARARLRKECSLARICNPCYYPQHPEYRTDDDKPNQRKGKVKGTFEEMFIHKLVSDKRLVING